MSSAHARPGAGAVSAWAAVVTVQRGFVFAAVKEGEDSESGWEGERGRGGGGVRHCAVVSPHPDGAFESVSGRPQPAVRGPPAPSPLLSLRPSFSLLWRENTAHSRPPAPHPKLTQGWVPSRLPTHVRYYEMRRT